MSRIPMIWRATGSRVRAAAPAGAGAGAGGEESAAQYVLVVEVLQQLDLAQNALRIDLVVEGPRNLLDGDLLPRRRVLARAAQAGTQGVSQPARGPRPPPRPPRPADGENGRKFSAWRPESPLRPSAHAAPGRRRWWHSHYHAVRPMPNGLDQPVVARNVEPSPRHDEGLGIRLVAVATLTRHRE